MSSMNNLETAGTNGPLGSAASSMDDLESPSTSHFLSTGNLDSTCTNDGLSDNKVNDASIP